MSMRTEKILDANLFTPITDEEEKKDVNLRPSISYGKYVWMRFKKNRRCVICVSVILFLILGAIIFPLLSSYSISETDYANTLVGYGQKGHIFGTDILGRDMWVRTWYGTRISLGIAFVAVLLNFSIAVVYGGISGLYGGIVDIIMMRIVEIITGIPQLIIWILLMVVLKPGVSTIIFGFAIVGWTGTARMVRGQVLLLREQEYVKASKLLGASNFRLIFRHMIPNIMGLMLLSLAMTVPGAIFMESFLSYIGLGVQIPLASLGTLSNEGTKIFQAYPHALLSPALFISIIMLVFNILGDAMRDVLDPKFRK